jgi:hypothetical protein
LAQLQQAHGDFGIRSDQNVDRQVAKNFRHQLEQRRLVVDHQQGKVFGWSKNQHRDLLSKALLVRSQQPYHAQAAFGAAGRKQGGTLTI